MGKDDIVVIYGKEQCPYCDKAKALCEQRGFTYTYKQLDVDFTAEEMKEEFPTARTFPQIIFNGGKVGGYDALEAIVAHQKEAAGE
jgi:glutaredoxin